MRPKRAAVPMNLHFGTTARAIAYQVTGTSPKSSQRPEGSIPAPSNSLHGVQTDQISL